MKEVDKHKRRRKLALFASSKMSSLIKQQRDTIASILLSSVFVVTILAALIPNQIVQVKAIASNLTRIEAPAISHTSTSSSNQAQIQATFSTPNPAINITHVTYDPLHDTVYLGATNAIYQLSGTDLSEQYQQTTGPILDNPACGITECHGYEDYMKITTNVNKVLVIDYQHKKLLSCGSTKQGACRRYQLNNIAQREDLISMAVAANDDNSSTYAFIAPARYTYDRTTSSITVNTSQQQLQQPQQVLYVAATYTKVGQSRDLLVPAIGTRTLDDGPNLLKLYENSFLDSARIDINSHLRDYFLVNYLYGFASSNYIYFVTVQKKATSRDYEELGYHTRLARICITDSSYNSYTEVDLKCMPNKRRAKNQPFGQQQVPTEYPLLQDAILVDAGSQLLRSLSQNDQSSPLSDKFFFSGTTSGSPDDGKVLLGVFSSAKDHTQHAGEHSAVCAFSLSQIEDKFTDNIHSCFTGKMQSRNMEYIAGNVQECPKSGQVGNVVNFCAETLKINGTLPIISEASIQFNNTTLTAITATSHINSNIKNIYQDQLANELSFNASKPITQIPSSSLHQNAVNQQQHTVVFVGTSNGHLKKILLNNASNGFEFEDVQLDTNPILSDLHLHSSGQQIIAATPYKVMKVPTHNCPQYATCRECSQSKSPYCGWCSLKRSCTTKNECISSSSSSSSGLSEAQPQPRAGGQPEASKQLKWISNESAGKCIDLQAIVPDRVPITSTGKVDLYIDRLPKLPNGQSYKCVFDMKEQTTATPMLFGLTCPLPKVMHRPKIPPGRDHAIVDLAVRSSETGADFLNGKMIFFECQLHTTCKDCLSTNWGCNWCLNENVCLYNTSKCEKTGQLQIASRQDNSLVQLTGQQRPTGSSTLAPLIANGQPANQRSVTVVSGGSVVQFSNGNQRTSNTINQVNQCPTFDVGHKQDILIANGSEKELAIRVKNMPQFKGNIKCIVEIENDKIPLKARIEEDRVVCENSTYSYTADVGLLNGQLEVRYSDNNNFIDRTNFTLYKCPLLGTHLNRPDCSLCQSVGTRFDCVWCSGSCHHKSQCTERPDDTCPPPRIDFIHPLSGPTSGGTRVTIEGSNLGQSFEEIANRVTIGNVACKPIEVEYRTSNRIVCITSPVVAARYSNRGFFEGNDMIQGDVVVGNRAGYSIGSNKFLFKSIFLRDFHPRHGPQSGGTRITLVGGNLNIGSSIQVFLDELPCEVEPASITSEQVVCKTSSSKQGPRSIRQLKLIVDDAQVVRDEDVFEYIQDPVITKITPLRSYLSGGRPIDVYGSNLNAIQVPRMIIVDSTTNRKVNESICILQNHARMQCPSPTVNLQMMDLEWNEQHIGQYDTQTFTQLASSTATNQATGFKLSQAFQQDESVRFRLGFIMDNVWSLRDLRASYPSLKIEIAYTSDPKLYPFASDQYKIAQEANNVANEPSNLAYQQSYQVESDTYLLQPGEPNLVLYGEHLRVAVSEYEITITIGQDLCNLTLLTQTNMVCSMPRDRMSTPTDEEGHQTQRGLPLVVVRIGFNLRYELGFVQYHPLLANQIEANSIEQLPRGTYKKYTPLENESLLHRISGYITTSLLMLFYVTLVSVLLAFVYSTLFLGYRLKRKSYIEYEYKRIQSQIDAMEKSVRSECRIATLALQSDLNELVRHVDLSGVPLLNVKHYIMKVFFPGINNHPLLVKSNEVHLGNTLNANSNHLGSPNANFLIQQDNASIPTTLRTSSDFPMEYFERLVLTKPFLLTFINTLEMQPSFTIRDRVNVASLIMIILMERLDYATDILKTLLFQLVEKSVSKIEDCDENEEQDYCKSGYRLTRKASNLLGGLPITKRASRTGNLGKVVGGSASSLMASTTVAAQMFLSRVGNKTSPLQPNSSYMSQTNLADGSATMGQFMSTTTFNQNDTMIHTIGGRSSSRRRNNRPFAINKSSRNQSYLMLRRTDSVVEKMLTNWLALNMYDYFQGDVGKSLYMMFEALKCQLDRGPIDTVSGDAYYSLNESKLLHEPYVQFEVVNLYIIIDTEILQPSSNTDSNLLLHSSSAYPYSLSGQSMIYDEGRHSGNYTTSNTITLALRVLDCDTISQVKAKILAALYRNSPNSTRLGVNDVELSLRQQQHLVGQQGTAGNQYITVTLFDDDYSSMTAYNGIKRVNTLRHYGITDQAIMMLNKCRRAANYRASQSLARTTLTDMLGEHYNNPYSEIQYGRCEALNSNQDRQQTVIPSGKSWHLIRPDVRHSLLSADQHSSNSSPSSQSPSMLLLASDANATNKPKIVTSGNKINQVQQHHQQQQQYYHPSSSSTSSTGNVMDSSSTSVHSSSMNVTNLLMRSREQPIYCQIGSASTRSQHGAAGSSYYCQIGLNNAPNTPANYQASHHNSETLRQSRLDKEQERNIYLTRMLTSKGTVQGYIDNFFKTILSVKPQSPGGCGGNEEENTFNTVLCGDSSGTSRKTNPASGVGACPPAVKWLFDLLDEAASENGITDKNVIDAWKSNAFLMRFWVNFIKNPDYILDVEKSDTLDATLSVVAQTLMDSCSANEQKLDMESSNNKLLFAKDIPKYRGQVKRFYQDISSLRQVSDQEIVRHMSSLSRSNSGRFDTSLALRELCVYAVNYGVELMGALNNDLSCQQLDLSQQLEQCFRSFTIFEAYR